MRIAGGMDVALGAVEPRRLLEQMHIARRVEGAGLSGRDLALPDCCRIIGSQPISSSAPSHTVMSAVRALAIRLGRAWIWCGSCAPVVAV